MKLVREHGHVVLIVDVRGREDQRGRLVVDRQGHVLPGCLNGRSGRKDKRKGREDKRKGREDKRKVREDKRKGREDMEGGK